MPHVSFSLETCVLVDRHTFSDKHTSLYFLCFYRLRFKKCLRVPSPFVFSYVLIETVGKPEACHRLGEGSDTGEFNCMIGFHLEIYLCS